MLRFKSSAKRIFTELSVPDVNMGFYFIPVREIPSKNSCCATTRGVVMTTIAAMRAP